ncbi:unnamed protein product [Rodentolepis nana]|uniref:Ovule protein n=1 Tax=Rodentolepis nana TaxID=102285 RepID=A0A0R3TW30_RODNA|nr:unnamed protein product [Rodentolepis nana]
MVFSMETLARVRSGELEPCSAYLVESLPEGVIYPPSAPSLISTSFAWDLLIFKAKRNISIASFYWSMLREDVYNSSSAYQVISVCLNYSMHSSLSETPHLRI